MTSASCPLFEECGGRRCHSLAVAGFPVPFECFERSAERAASVILGRGGARDLGQALDAVMDRLVKILAGGDTQAAARAGRKKRRVVEVPMEEHEYRLGQEDREEDFEEAIGPHEYHLVLSTLGSTLEEEFGPQDAEQLYVAILGRSLLNGQGVDFWDAAVLCGVPEEVVREVWEAPDLPSEEHDDLQTREALFAARWPDHAPRLLKAYRVLQEAYARLPEAQEMLQREDKEDHTPEAAEGPDQEAKRRGRKRKFQRELEAFGVDEEVAGKATELIEKIRWAVRLRLLPSSD